MPKIEDLLPKRVIYTGKYGAQWYKHYAGMPPLDDDRDYVWTGSQWTLFEVAYGDGDE